MISLRPITSRFRSKLLSTSIVDAAETTVELPSCAVRAVELPIMLPGAPARILGHHSSSAPALNVKRLNSSLIEQGPTRLHLLRDVIIADGTVLSTKFFDRIAAKRKSFIVRGNPEEISEAMLCSTWFTERYFGHWLREGLSFEQLAADRHLTAIVHDRDPWVHEASYRRLLGFNARRVALARCDRLWVIEEPRYNDQFANRYKRIRKRLHDRIAVRTESPARVFLSRGNLAIGRTLRNEEQVRHELGARGFTIVDPEVLDAEEIAHTLASARLVVAAEGSALAHAAIALPSGAGMIAIMGAQHFNMNYKGVSDALDLHFGFTVADAVDREGFSQPIDRLLRAIDLVEERVAPKQKTGAASTKSPSAKGRNRSRTKAQVLQGSRVVA